jgi:hypothetical protein
MEEALAMVNMEYKAWASERALPARLPRICRRNLGILKRGIGAPDA